jgi:nicotinamide-nucleotide amidase
MKADIITIGDEILIGQIVDTNSAYIAAALDLEGIETRKVISVSDRRESIIETLDESVLIADLVIITGGLGPTNDDITKKSLQDYFGGEFIFDQQALKFIEILAKRHGVKLTGRNRLQAAVPSSCFTLPNRLGSAPGMVFRKENCVVIALPGVPFEMKQIFDTEVIPLLHKEFKLPVRLKKTILTAGLPESRAADLLEDWESGLTGTMRLAYLPSVGRVRLRLSISGEDQDQLKDQLNKEINTAIGLLGTKYVYGFDDETLEGVVGRMLTSISGTLSVAESCTGGTIASMITSVPGSSSYFKGGVIAYANPVKQHLLKVSETDISRFGAVSREVVEQMAQGVRQLMDTDYSIATSGIAGPTGGSTEKPVGTTWIAIAAREKVISERFIFTGNRERNIERASVTALNMLRNILVSEEENNRGNV